MDTHDPGKRHADQGGEQSQRVILLANNFVVQAKNMLPNETGRSVVGRRSGHVVHYGHLTSKEMFGIPNLVAKAGIAKTANNYRNILLLAAL
jgi:hypothetical protein